MIATISIIAAAVITASALGYSAHRRAQRAADAVAPLTFDQLRAALSKGNKVGPSTFTMTDQISAGQIDDGRVCSPSLTTLFGDQNTVLSATARETINPSTGLVENQPFLAVYASTLPTTADAATQYPQSSDFTNCLAQQMSGTQGATAPGNYQVINTNGGQVYIVMVHRNVLAVLTWYDNLDTNDSRADNPAEVIDALTDLLDKSRAH